MLDLFIKIYEIFIIKNTSKLGEVKISSVIFFFFCGVADFFSHFEYETHLPVSGF